MRQMLLLLLAALIPSLAQAELEPGVTAATLDNGLEIVVIEDHRAPVVVHMLWYRVGAADEPKGASGVAHYLEHLLFKATESHEAGEFSRLVNRHGGADNAFTSRDYTAYYQRIAASKLPLMMEFEADRMRNLLLSAEDAATELQVVLEERNQRIDSNPDALAYEQFNAALYGDHPYGDPIIGWYPEISAMTAEAARDIYDRFYAPNNAILIVAGDVQPEDVVALAKTYYGPLQPSDTLPVRARVDVAPLNGPLRETFTDARVGRSYLTRSYLAPERDSGAQEKAAALVYLAELLGGSPFTSRLGRALQFDNQTAVYSAASYGDMSLDRSSFDFTIVPAEGVSLAEAEAELDRVIDEFLSEGPSEERMNAIANQLRAQEIFLLDSTMSRARRYGAALTQGLAIEDIAAWPGVLQQVTREDVMDAAQQVLRPENSLTGYVTRPQEAKE